MQSQSTNVAFAHRSIEHTLYQRRRLTPSFELFPRRLQKSRPFPQPHTAQQHRWVFPCRKGTASAYHVVSLHSNVFWKYCPSRARHWEWQSRTVSRRRRRASVRISVLFLFVKTKCHAWRLHAKNQNDGVVKYEMRTKSYRDIRWQRYRRLATYSG